MIVMVTLVGSFMAISLAIQFVMMIAVNDLKNQVNFMIETAFLEPNVRAKLIPFRKKSPEPFRF